VTWFEQALGSLAHACACYFTLCRGKYGECHDYVDNYLTWNSRMQARPRLNTLIVSNSHAYLNDTPQKMRSTTLDLAYLSRPIIKLIKFISCIMRNYLKHLGESHPIHRLTIMESTYWMLLVFVHDSAALLGLGPMGWDFEITLRHTTLGRTPLDEWASCRRDLYLITRKIHDRHPCHRRHSNPQSQQHK